MESHVKSGQQVLVIWKHLVAGETLKDCVDSLQKSVGKTGKVYLENIERLVMSSHKKSSFDVILSGVIPQSIVIHNDEMLTEYLRILKPNGLLVIHEPNIESGEHPIVKVHSKLTSALQLSGFLNIDAHKFEAPLEAAVEQQLKEDYNFSRDFHMLEVICNKPDFEVGSSCLLNLKSHASSDNTAKIWSTSSGDNIDEDIIDSDQLLDEEDLLKPDPTTLKSPPVKRRCLSADGNFSAPLSMVVTPAQQIEDLRAEKKKLHQKCVELKEGCSNLHQENARLKGESHARLEKYVLLDQKYTCLQDRHDRLTKDYDILYEEHENLRCEHDKMLSILYARQLIEVKEKIMKKMLSGSGKKEKKQNSYPFHCEPRRQYTQTRFQLWEGFLRTFSVLERSLFQKINEAGVQCPSRRILADYVVRIYEETSECIHRIHFYFLDCKSKLVSVVNALGK